MSKSLPTDFTPIKGCVPEWIDIEEICKESKRFVGLYAMENFDVVAINSGKCVYTTADRNGEFRRNLQQYISLIRSAAPVSQSESDDPTIVYDCEDRLEWIAPRESAVRFLFSQF